MRPPTQQSWFGLTLDRFLGRLTVIVSLLTAFLGLADLLSGRSRLPAYLLFYTGLLVLWLFCLYLRRARRDLGRQFGVSNELQPVYSRRRRQLALGGLILLPIAACVPVILLLLPDSPPSKNDPEQGTSLILVADFEGLEPKRYRITEVIIEKLEEVGQAYSGIEIRALGSPITAQQGSAEARRLGASHGAKLVVWGWYGITASNVVVVPHLETLSSRHEWPVVDNRKIHRLAVEHLETFELQLNLSEELSSMALLALALAHYERNELEATTRLLDAFFSEQSSDPHLVASAHYYRGNCHYFRGHLLLALQDYEKAMKTGSESPHLMHNLASLHLQLGYYRQAEAMFLRLLDAPGAATGPDVEIRARLGLALASYRLGHRERAVSILEATLQMLGQASDSETRVQILNNLGAIYTETGRYGAALDVLEQAERLAERINGPLIRAAVFVNLALLNRKLHRADEALSYLDRALALHEQRTGLVRYSGKMGDPSGPKEQIFPRRTPSRPDPSAMNHEFSGRVLDQLEHLEAEMQANRIFLYLGEAHYAMSQLKEARRHLRIARELSERLGDSSAEAQAWLALASVHGSLGDYDSAKDALDKADEILQSVEDPLLKAKYLETLGELSHTTGQLDTARRAYVGAAELAEEIGADELLAEVLFSRGLVLEELGARAEAVGCYEEALEAYKRLLQAFEDVRVGEEDLPEEIARVYERLVAVLADEGLIAEAFAATEAANIHALTFRLRGARLTEPLNELGGWLAQEQDLRAEIHGLKVTLASRWTRLEGGDTASVAELFDQRLRSLQEKRESILAELRERHSLLLRWVEPSQPNVEAVLSSLPRNGAILSYFVTERRLFIFLVTAEGVRGAEVPVSGEGLKRRVQHYVFALSRHQPHLNQNIVKPESQALYQLLLRPLEAELGSFDVVGIVPGQALAGLPFETLDTGKGFVGELFPLFYLPAASSLGYGNSDRVYTGPGSALVVGVDLEVTREGAEYSNLRRLAEAALGDDMERHGGSQLRELPRLHNTEEEAREIAQVLGTKAVLGTHATKGAILERAGQYKILHFAAHRVSVAGNLSGSRLLLAATDQEDGVLEAADLPAIDLASTRLVVLSSSLDVASSSGPQTDTLGQAWFLAGVPNVIVRRWEVDDRAMASFLDYFYRVLLLGEGATIPETLGRAQQMLREEPRFQSPHYWGSFYVIGDPTQGIQEGL